MEAVRALLSALANVRGPLTFWSFMAVVLVTALYFFLTSTKFHGVWTSLYRDKLGPTHFFRIARIFVVGLLALVFLTVVLAFAAPLLLQRMTLDSRSKTEVVELAVSESNRAREDYESALRIFREDRDYESALIAFHGLERRVKEAASKDALSGMITASFYGLGKHREGLDYICRKYREFPATSTRFRFDIHAHARRIALKEGYQAAEGVLIELRTRCRHADFSPVWAGVPLVHMEHLKRNEPDIFLYEYPLPEKDRNFLRYVIARYPTDAFVDHAKYFLHDFYAVLTEHPGSMLLEFALFSAIASGELGELGRIEEAESFLVTFPKSAYATSVVADLIREYFAAGRMHEALETHQHYKDALLDKEILREYRMSGHPLDPSIARIGLAKVFAEAARYDQLEAFCGDWTSQIYFGLGFMNQDNYPDVFRLLAKYRLAEDCGDVANVWTSLANPVPELVAAGKYAEAVRRLNSAQQAFTSIGVDATSLDFVGARRTLKGWDEIERRGSPEQRFAMALQQRDGFESQDTSGITNVIGAISSSSALQTLRRLQSSDGKGVYGDKTLYLIAALQRRLRDFKDAAESLQLFERSYPSSPLLDDVICEQGLHELWFGKKSAAYRLFGSVVTRFPQSNAADNALNWLAWSHLRDRQYGEAMKYYAALASNYVRTRIGRRAALTLTKLQDIVGTRATRAAINGLIVRGGGEYFDGQESWLGIMVDEIVPNSDAASAKLRYGDLIYKVNGETMDGDENVYYSALQSASDDGRTPVRLNVLRGKDPILLFAAISREEHYPKDYGEID